MAKTWFITGTSTGFGYQFVELLLKKGEKVVATARNLEKLKSFGLHDNLLTLTLDVTKPADIKAAVQKAIHKFGTIDVLVNNAGYGMVGAIEESEMNAVRKMFETNVFGLMELTQEFLPHFRKQKHGHIVNMSSVAGVVGTPGFGMYNSTKHAVEGFSEALSHELAPFNVRVTLIEPGPFRTDFANRSLATMPEMVEYAETVGKTRAALSGYADGKQPGDPVAAAHIIFDLVNSANPPLRLPLGKSAYERITAKLNNWQALVKSQEALVLSADYAA